MVGGHYRPWSEFADLLDEITGLPLTRVTAPGWLMRLSGDLGDLVKRFVPFDIPATREAVTYATEWVYADSSHLRDDLGFEFRDLRETLVDTIL